MHLTNENREELRLSALHGLDILDSPMEDSYDRIVDLVSRTFDVPIARISLVDRDREWFKAKRGIDEHECDRSIAICSLTIQRSVPLIIEDATQDERTKHNPLVLGGPHIRFYAGAPLILSGGEKVGALCILDLQPRRLTPAQVVTLQRVADIIVRKLELRRAVKQLFWDVAENFDAGDLS